jgi:cytochrome c oxidase subunit IV
VYDRLLVGALVPDRGNTDMMVSDRGNTDPMASYLLLNSEAFILSCPSLLVKNLGMKSIICTLFISIILIIKVN